MYKLIKFLEEMEKAPYRESMRYVHKIPRLIERSYRKPRTQKSGVRPTLYMVNPNGKWVSKIYDSAYGYSNKKAAAGERLLQNYENAMHRRRSYTYQGVRDFGLEYPMRAIKDPISNSFIIDAPDDLPIFHPTHFSPETLRGGSRLIKEAAVSLYPIAFTVTEDLSPMLLKSGFIEIGKIPLIFNGLYVTKSILVNKSTGNYKNLLTRALKQNGIRDVDVEEIIKTIENAPEPTYKSLILNGVIISPESSELIKDTPLQGFTFKDLLKNK